MREPVYPTRGLGVGETWGRTVEANLTSLVSEVNNLRNEIFTLKRAVASLETRTGRVSSQVIDIRDED